MKNLLLAILMLVPFWGRSQHKEVSYELINEIGTFKLTSLTFSHEKDNREGITFVTDKTGKDTLYHLDEFLNGWVAVSNDGRTLAHLITEKNGKPLDGCQLSFFRDGKHFDTASLFRFLKYELDDVVQRDRLPESGWLRNDSLLHKMASNPFYITDDKLYISMDGPKLMVFDMNAMFHIYTGNGANHFFQNYYSIPNAPLRKEFTSEEYFPIGFPKTEDGKMVETAVASVLNDKTAIPEEAKFRAEVSLKLNADGSADIRKAAVFSTKTNEEVASESEKLKKGLNGLKFETSLLPPDHPAWIFSDNFWLK
ncbi:MAG: hypothetical protein GC178_07355 [Flavobacteriales bacterium]|nr:hypothetical protein [Flavobacteriales bacterium]